MWKVLGGIFLVSGMIGVLHSWILSQKERQKKLEEFLLFLHRSVSIMRTEKIKVIDYFAKQELKVLQEISRRLATNTYQRGQSAWEEVFAEEKQSLSFDEECFQMVLKAGAGFFGKSREENIRFLEKSICELEGKQKEMKNKDANERRVWIPVGVLGAVMLVIIFI